MLLASRCRRRVVADCVSLLNDQKSKITPSHHHTVYNNKEEQTADTMTSICSTCLCTIIEEKGREKVATVQ